MQYYGRIVSLRRNLELLMNYVSTEYLRRDIQHCLGSLARGKTTLRLGCRHVASHSTVLHLRDCANPVEGLSY